MSGEPRPQPQPPVDDPAAVAEIVAAIRAAGAFALDLEFASDGRYVPELCLVQVSWGEPDDPEVAAVDPLAVDAAPLAELVADPGLPTVLHAGQADLALLAEVFGVTGRAVRDTQIAAAFVGVGDQIGYAGLIAALLGVELDKGAQFTRWCRRPLAPRQLRYALDDVRYLPAAWARLGERLAEAGRAGWVEEECERLAADAAERRRPDELYLRIAGWDRLKPRSLGVLRAVAAWRERQALATNTPPRWLLSDRAVLELARRLPHDPRGLRGIRGLDDRVRQEHGEAVLAAVTAGAAEPLAPPKRSPPLPERAQSWVSVVWDLVQGRCRDAGVAPRFVASKSDAETLVRWWLAGGGPDEPELPLLAGWRCELAGETALDWLAGRVAVAADGDAESGLRLVPRGDRPAGDG